MDGIEEVVYQNKPIAIVFRRDLPVDGIKFLTTQDNPFQIGIQNRPKDTHLPAHTHPLKKPLSIKEVQEILYVISGKIKVTLVSKKGEPIDIKILTDGDSILLMREGHGVDFLEESRVFEVKQGPFPGVQGKEFIK